MVPDGRRRCTRDCVSACKDDSPGQVCTAHRRLSEVRRHQSLFWQTYCVSKGEKMQEKYQAIERLCNTTNGLVKTINRGGLALAASMRNYLIRVAKESGESSNLESFVIDGKFLLLENGNIHKITYPKPTRTLTTRYVMTRKEFMESHGWESFISEPYM